jgi:hypothetical protein
MPETMMMPEEFDLAMVILGERWNRRRLTDAQMARALRLNGGSPSESIRGYRRGHTPISGPISLVVAAYLGGWEPPDGIDYVLDGEAPEPELL